MKSPIFAVLLVVVLGAYLGAQEKESLVSILVEGGTFSMGSDNYPTSNEGPAHTVTLSSFRIGETEVTYAQFAEFIAATQYKTSCEKDGKGSFVFDNGHLFYKLKTASWRKTNFEQSNDSPVISLSWIDAIHYLNWLSLRDGFTPAYTIQGELVNWNPDANGWRLPTEAEWEYAARGGLMSKGFLYGGSNKLGEVAWYDENSKFTTHPIKQKQPNELGLFDIIGNAYEWCWDWYGSYSTKAETNPKGPQNGVFRIYRGGSWYSGPYINEELRNTTRSFGQANVTYNYNGLRVARNQQ